MMSYSSIGHCRSPPNKIKEKKRKRKRKEKKRKETTRQ
jgi:hypothetical protein